MADAFVYLLLSNPLMMMMMAMILIILLFEGCKYLGREEEVALHQVSCTYNGRPTVTINLGQVGFLNFCRMC